MQAYCMKCRKKVEIKKAEMPEPKAKHAPRVPRRVVKTHGVEDKGEEESKEE